MIDNIIYCIIVCVPRQQRRIIFHFLLQLGSIREARVYLFSQGTEYDTPKDWSGGKAKDDEIVSCRQAII